MTKPIKPIPARQARWDGRRVLFEIVDDGQSFACAISLNALQDLSTMRRFKPADLLKCFDETRERIEAIALAKLRARPGGVAGVLNIWSDDLDDVPPSGAPALAQRPSAQRAG
jgi:hypothetical protein